MLEGSLQIQQQIRRAVVGELGASTIKAFHERSAFRTLASLAHIWGAVVLTFAAVGWMTPLPLAASIPGGILACAFMATRINAFNVLVHEGSHGSLARSRGLNEALTNWGAGYGIGFDTASYRAVHLRHHRWLNTREDPDRRLYEVPPERRALFRAFLMDLFWVTATSRALEYARSLASPAGLRARRREGLPGPRHLAGKVVVNGVMVGALVLWKGAALGVGLYFAFWIVPLFSLYPVIVRFRTIAEHFAPELTDGDPERPVFVARTSVVGRLEHYFLGAQMEYHWAHHLYPGIAYSELRRMHGELERIDFFRSTAVIEAHSLTGGYLHYWGGLLGSGYFAKAGEAAATRGR